MESLLKSAFDHMVTTNFTCLKTPQLMTISIHALKTILQIHKETYEAHSQTHPQHTSQFLTVTEQEELIDEYCNINKCHERRVQLKMNFLCATTHNEQYSSKSTPIRLI